MEPTIFVIKIEVVTFRLDFVDRNTRSTSKFCRLGRKNVSPAPPLTLWLAHLKNKKLFL
jgi:hypothetical protein